MTMTTTDPTLPVIAADLHTHTTCSDGVFTPEQVLDKATARGIQVLAFADHDTVEAHHVMRSQGYNGHVRLLAGIEVSCYEQGREIHVLGYAFDIDNPELLQHAAAQHIERETRARLMVDRLCHFGRPISFQEVADGANGAPIGRPHIAAVLVKRGHVSSVQQAFDQWLDTSRPAYVPRKVFTVAEAVRMIRNAGGISSIAHPMRTFADPRSFLQLVASGIDGVEVFHPSHFYSTREYYRVLAKQHGLIVTGGSDFHGSRDYDDRNLGRFGLTQDRLDTFTDALHVRSTFQRLT